MKKIAFLLFLLPFGGICQNRASRAPQPPTEFASPAEAKAFFYGLDDQHNHAMLTHDSAFYVRLYADSFINCDPFGALANKAAEIQNQLHARDWVSVERIAPQFDVFTYGGNTALLMMTKHVRFRTPTGIVDTYPRRTIAFQKNNGQWQAVAGQVTYLKPAVVEAVAAAH